uniref:Uncharacterized protein n=1 Tax=Steinernema glaseri TaxID=37863 RepID=A0A1I8ATV6_9BILA
MSKCRRKLNSMVESCSATESKADCELTSLQFTSPLLSVPGNSEEASVDSIVDALILCNRILRCFSTATRDDLELLVNVTRKEKSPKVVVSLVKKEERTGDRTESRPKDTFVHDDSRCFCGRRKAVGTPVQSESSRRESMPLSEIPTAVQISEDYVAERRLVAEIRPLRGS